MPLYMDVHPGLGDATPEDVAAAHQRDLEIQGDFGVEFLSYWVSAETGGKAFCLANSPDEDSLRAVHKVAHGLMPHNIIQIEESSLASLMGVTSKDETDRVLTADGVPDTALRAIMFTDIAGSTEVSTARGDAAALQLLRRHNEVVRNALDEFGGNEVKHTGDGVLASFVSVTRAVGAAIAIQKTCAAVQENQPTLAVKIGLGVGEPVEDSNDLFGAAVNLAARLCAHASGGQILTSSTVRDLSIGKEFIFENQGAVGLKGFPDAVQLYSVEWSQSEN